MSNAAVSLKKIVKIFKAGNETVNILNEADFEIKKGDTVAVTGESGTGKSTLLHIMGTLLKPDSGNIEYFGQSDVYSLSDENLARFRNKKYRFRFSISLSFKRVQLLRKCGNAFTDKEREQKCGV